MIEAEVLGLLDAHFKRTHDQLPRRPKTDRNLTFDDVDPCSSDSELGDLIGTLDRTRDTSSDVET